jgi:hypothetical protein
MIDVICRRLSAAVLISTTIVVAVMTTTAIAKPITIQRKGPSPFCVDAGGSNGPGSRPQDCQYYDYQSCIEAAAVRGNCVRNIELK